MPSIILHWLVLLWIPLAVGMPFSENDPATEYELSHTTWVYPPWGHTWGIVRATQTQLKLLTLGKASFRNPQGLDVVRLIATDDPEKRGDDVEVTVYGVNSGENSIIYNRSMTRLGLFGYDDETRGILDAPWDVAALPDGQVFVTDSGHRRVVKLRNVDGELRVEGSFGDHGDLALGLPRGIAVTEYGSVVVADAANDRVTIYDTTGVVRYSIGGFVTPLGVAAVEGERDHVSNRYIPSDEQSYIVVSDSLGRRLTKITFEGEVIARRVMRADSVAWPPYMGHVEIDSLHNVIASDSSNHRLLKFMPTLEPVTAWGQRGEGRGRFEGPTGVTVWRRYGQTFVAQSDGAHYLWVGVDLVGTPTVSFIDDRVLRINTFLTEKADIYMKLVNSEGDTVRTKSLQRRIGRQSFRWTLDRSYFTQINAQGLKRVLVKDPLPAGDYRLLMHVIPTYSARRVVSKDYELSVALPVITEADITGQHFPKVGSPASP